MRLTILALCALVYVGHQNLAHASIHVIEATVDVTSADGDGLTPGQLSYAVSTAAFTVESGDTVRAYLRFSEGDFFSLLFDTAGPTVGTQGRLYTSSPTEIVEAQYGFSFGFLDSSMAPILADSASPRSNGGGNFLRGDVSLVQAQDINVYGLFLEFTNITNVVTGGLPAEFDSVHFIVTDGVFGEPFRVVPPSGEVPEPASIVVWSLLAVVGAGVAWRRQRRTVPIA